MFLKEGSFKYVAVFIYYSHVNSLLTEYSSTRDNDGS